MGKDGRVWRLTKESWDITIPYDSDPNQALLKMQAQIVELEKRAPAVTSAGEPCKFNEKTLKETIKSTMEEVLRPFMGS